MNPKKLVGVVAVCTMTTFGASVFAQQSGNTPSTPQAAEARPPAPPPVPVKVTVVISRYQGEKKVSNLPYTLLFMSGESQSLRMGAQVPVLTGGPGGAINYQNVGLNIDCSASAPRTDGRFQLTLIITDSQVSAGSAATPPIPTPSGAPIIQNFTTQSRGMLLRDGQTAQVATATDKVTGEVVKVDVTLDVVK